MEERISRQRSRRTRQHARRGHRPVIRLPLVGLVFLGWIASALMLAGPRVDPHAVPAVGKRAPAGVTSALDFSVADPRDRAETVPALVAIPRGTPLVAAGERITPTTHARLRAHHERLQVETPRTDRWVRLAVDAILMGLALLAGLAVWYRIRPEDVVRLDRIALMLTLGFLGLVMVRALLHPGVARPGAASALAAALNPLALAPLLGGLLAGPALALATGLWIAFGAAVLAGHSFPLFAMGLVVTAATLLAVQHARSRARIVRAGLAIGLAQAAAVLALHAGDLPTGQVLALQAAVAVAASLAAALAALLLLPLFEVIFGLTTDVRLLELSDPGHPLLQRLALEAPGTYHHSMMMATLAHAAAERIGANALLVRVCAYFHDVGKLTKPEYFTENAPRGHNPHDELSPAMSTLIITSHVKEGVGLAQHYKLPRPVLDGIRQHHGTSAVSFFYDRARRRGPAAGDEAAREDDFRYGGPKPMSREMSILALADALEAASRSLEKASPARIENLVEDIVWKRLKDGQLDKAALTFRELTEVKRSFVFTLINMLHGRVAYPRHEPGAVQPATMSPAQASGPATAGPEAGRTGVADATAVDVEGDRGDRRG